MVVGVLSWTERRLRRPVGQVGSIVEVPLDALSPDTTAWPQPHLLTVAFYITASYSYV